MQIRDMMVPVGDGVELQVRRIQHEESKGPAKATGCDALIFNRQGYGQSSDEELPRPIRQIGKAPVPDTTRRHRIPGEDRVPRRDDARDFRAAGFHRPAGRTCPDRPMPWEIAGFYRPIGDDSAESGVSARCGLQLGSNGKLARCRIPLEVRKWGAYTCYTRQSFGNSVQSAYQG